MRLVLYKEQVGGMLVGVTPRPFWYVSWGEPVVVLFRVPVLSSSGRPWSGLVGWLVASFFFGPSQPSRQISTVGTVSSFFFFFRPSQPSRQISTVGTVSPFFVCKPVVVGGRGPAEENLNILG